MAPVQVQAPTPPVEPLTVQTPVRQPPKNRIVEIINGQQVAHVELMIPTSEADAELSGNGAGAEQIIPNGQER